MPFQGARAVARLSALSACLQLLLLGLPAAALESSLWGSIRSRLRERLATAATWGGAPPYPGQAWDAVQMPPYTSPYDFAAFTVDISDLTQYPKSLENFAVGLRA